MKKTVSVGNVQIGNGKIAIQSMTNTPTIETTATLAQIKALAVAGADLVRITVPDTESAKSVPFLVQNSPVPLIGDIHYTAKAALIAIEGGVSKIRINPGNMKEEEIRSVIKKCAEYRVPVRVGVNKGSTNARTPEELARLAVDCAKKIEDYGWDQIVLAVKSSNVAETVAAYRQLSNLTEYPLHIGLTEAGTADMGGVKSAVAIGSLLLDGIGDTVRVSLAGDPVQEIYYAQKILRAVGLDRDYAEVVACPTCGRTCFPVEETAKAVEEMTKNVRKRMKIAVMGCPVNGIREASDADFGIAGGKEYSALFEKGVFLRRIPNGDILAELSKLVGKYNE